MTTKPLEFVARVDAQGPFRANLEAGQDVVDVTTMTGRHTPNLAWEFVDEAGHYHSWTKDGELPTLSRHEERIPYPNMSEDIDEAEEEVRVTLVCKLCGETVEPKYDVDHSPQFIPGRSYWNATVYGVHLHPGDMVSMSFSTARTGRVRYFGVAQVTAIEIKEATYVTQLAGAGPLGRKK